MGKEYTVKVKADTKDAVDGIEQVNDSIKDTSKSTEELSSGLDSTTGGAITKFKALKGTVINVVKSFKTLRGAILATGIGALILAITSLTQAFTASEEGQNRFAKILKELGVIAGNIGDIFYSLGDTIYNVFTGNFDEASKAFETFKDRVKNFGDETRREIALAGELADKIAAANKLERELLVERAKTNVEINKLKTKAAEVDKFTSEQRIAFLEQAASLEDKITQKEVDLAKIRRDIKIEENSLSESTKEDLDEEAQLVSEVIRLEEARLIRNKELLGVASGLRKMEADKKELERANELASFEKQQETISDILKNNIDKNERLVISSEENIGQKVRDIQLKKLRDSLKIEKLTTDQKIGLAQQALGNLTTIVGEESKAAKGAAIAQTTIDTYQSATSSYKSLSGIPIVGPVLGAIAAAAALANGFANVKAITAIGESVGPAPSAIAPRIAAPTAEAQTPDFNVVGSAGTNQLADAIAGVQAKPQRAYVVSNDVTTAQGLDRNIVEGASI